jgi:hypothetical protein
MANVVGVGKGIGQQLSNLLTEVIVTVAVTQFNSDPRRQNKSSQPSLAGTREHNDY